MRQIVRKRRPGSLQSLVSVGMNGDRQRPSKDLQPSYTKGLQGCWLPLVAPAVLGPGRGWKRFSPNSGDHALFVGKDSGNLARSRWPLSDLSSSACVPQHDHRTWVCSSGLYYNFEHDSQGPGNSLYEIVGEFPHISNSRPGFTWKTGFWQMIFQGP